MSLHALVFAITVTVMNPNGITGHGPYLPGHAYAYGATCRVPSIRDTVVVAPFDETRHLYAVQNREALLSSGDCPSGTYFLMTPADYAREETKERLAPANKELDRMREILKEKR